MELLDGEHVQVHGLERKDKSELTYITGVIRRDKVPGFERMLWRVSRGNAFLRILEIAEPFEDPKTVKYENYKNHINLKNLSIFRAI